MKNAIKATCLAFLSIFHTPSWACSENGTSGVLPENKLSYPLTEKNLGLTRAEYDAVINKVETIYSPIFRYYGGDLQIHRQWQSPRVNAGTYRDESGDNWHINLYGGFARHPEITQDGPTLALCHESGHHIGGAPKKTDSQPVRWSSNEGQADYFGTLKCFRTIFQNEDNRSAVLSLSIPESVKRKCDSSFNTIGDRDLCLRSSMAALSVGNVMADSQEEPFPSFETPDISEVDTTIEKHPTVQCRLDTYFMGSVCEVNKDVLVSQADEVKGTCHPKLGFKDGLRPNCWFKPKE
jgi:hypothetical protein